MSYRGGCATWGNVAAEGNSLRRCGASSLAREPWGRTAGVAREDKIYRPQKMFLLHESTGTWLPRGGRVGRVLPAVVADTAKAEGVAFGVAGILFVAGVLPLRRTEVGASWPIAAAAGLPLGRT